MDLITINGQSYLATDAYTRAMIEGSDGIVTAGGEVDLQLVAEVLNHVYCCIDDGLGIAVGTDKCGILKVDRADAEGKLLACGGPVICPIPSSTIFVVPSSPATFASGKKFMAGVPMKPATKRFAGWSYNSCGAPICWIMPPFRTAMRSPIVIASTWSWVT